MMLSIFISEKTVESVKEKAERINWGRAVVWLASIAAVLSTAYFYSQDLIVAYGDSESHLNIAKRVVHSLTPGFAQLGGIWLPLPHLLMVPFVYSDFLWRSGLAGSIVSGIAFVVSALYIYKLTDFITGRRLAGVFAALVFILNPNILYLQSTPMTELVLIAFFALSSYYFVRFIKNRDDLLSLILSALFGFGAVLSRYDGWFLVGIEAGIIGLLYFPWKSVPRNIRGLWENFDYGLWKKMEGRAILFSVLAFFGIALWLLWDFLILGDPLYFTTSQFSAKSQQANWLSRGELPAYQNIFVSFIYFFVTSMSNVGVVIFLLSLFGIFIYLSDRRDRSRFYIMLLFMTPFIFNVLTLFMGQSVIFIPHLTPTTFEWTLFNVRYGTMMVPLAAFALGYLFVRSGVQARILILGLFIFQLALYGVGYSKVISLADGVEGLSSSTAKQLDAQRWLTENYDGGLVLVDDFARTVSIIRTGIPMQNIIYVGTKPYWGNSLKEPERHATWIVMQQNDDVWKSIYDKPDVQGRMFAHFVKVYTSPEILIFKRSQNALQI